MPKTSPQEITQLLRAWSEGDQSALERLTPLVQQRLRRIAHAHLRRESPGHLLQSTALMDEAFIKLLKSPPVDWQDSGHFFVTMSRAMRRILVDMVRMHRDRIRLDGHERVPESEMRGKREMREPRLLAIDDALTVMETLYPRQSRVIELGYFGGHTQAEIAEILNVHVDTVRRDQKFALAWLKSEMQGEKNDISHPVPSVARAKGVGL